MLFILGQLTDSDVEWLANNGKRTKLPQGAELHSVLRPHRYRDRCIKDVVMNDFFVRCC